MQHDVVAGLADRSFDVPQELPIDGYRVRKRHQHPAHKGQALSATLNLKT